MAKPMGDTPATSTEQRDNPAKPSSTGNSTTGPVKSGAPLVVGGSQHGSSSSVSNRATSTNMASPAIAYSSNPAASGASATSDHSRKPSRTISSSGASGQIPNGGPAPNNPRPNISFGSINANGGSPAIASSTNYQQPSSLSSNPRVNSPAQSPTPIPQPAASGGLPPTGRQPSQSNGLSFGNISGPSETDNRQFAGAQSSPMMGQQNLHSRRTSSHSQHGDVPNAGANMSSGYVPRGGYGGQGRGRGNYNQGYSGPYSPSPGHRPYQGQRQGHPSNLPQHFQNHGGFGPQSQGVPHHVPRSPGPQGTPPVQPMQMHGAPMNMHPSYAQYMQQMNHGSGPYPIPPDYNAQFQPYYGYPNQPNYGAPGMPQSPGPMKQAPPTPHQKWQSQQFMGNQYGQNPMPQNMSRQSSSNPSERPASSIGPNQQQPHQPPQPPATPAGQSSHSHSQSTSAAPQSASFTKPPPSKGITIRNPQSGEAVTFDTKKPSPASTGGGAPSPSPATVSSNPTPPPRSSSTSSRNRSESKSSKTAAEIKAQFQEQVKKEQEKEHKIQEEGETGVSEQSAVIEDASAAKTTEVEPPTAEVVEPTSLETPAKPEMPTTNKADDGESAKPDAAQSQENDEERKKRLEEEEFERMVAEAEAQEQRELEQEREFQERRKKEAEEKAAKEKEGGTDDAMRQAEREAEAAEEAREKEKLKVEENESDATKDFASLKRPAIGPGATLEEGAETPKTATSEESTPLPRPAKPAGTSKPKPAALRLETAKGVEPSQPTPGMRSLQSARVLDLQNESVRYPDGIASPNPALNQTGRRGGRLYDKDFLLQFQDAFKEKPGLDWDQRVKNTLGDPADSSVPKSARTPSGAGPRPHAQRNPPSAFTQPPMGSFSRTLPRNTTSEERFRESSSQGNQARIQSNPFAQHVQRPMGGPVMQPGMVMRQQTMPPPQQMQAGNRGSQRGSKTGRVDSRPQQSRKEQEKDNSKMPLTAGSQLKPLEASGVGWKPPSIGRTAMPGLEPSGHLAPDMVQRKVKSNLNKMTPERFEKITDQILNIAAQSRNESDGRTLRQVIALTFEKACDEAHWASMYAKFCKRMLEDMTSDLKDENVKDKNGNPVVGGALFRKYLLNRCQEEFERGWEVNLPLNPEGEKGETAMMSDEYYQAAAAKRRGLGLVQFIGELYKLGMLSMRIMHECVQKLLEIEGEPDEASIEGLSKLLRTVGETMESTEGGPKLVQAYFERIETIMTWKLPSRMNFMLLDVVDLRKKRWRSKDDAKGPKTIQEIHEEAVRAQQQAEMERQRQTQRGGGGRLPSGRGDGRNFSSGAMGPPDTGNTMIQTNDLRRLNQKQSQTRQGSTGPSRIGPSSMFAQRSGSGRMSLGPPGGLMARGGDDSSPSSSLHSRSASVKAGEKKDEDQKSSLNAFR
ncbi:MAG: hypothetical protein M1831_007344 [Alyxoria varia]|nr:MAG: hypothetical protein M1831_007344 [Alyxoria varia]